MSYGRKIRREYRNFYRRHGLSRTARRRHMRRTRRVRRFNRKYL